MTDNANRTEPAPVDIEVSRRQRMVTVTWSDGHQTRHSWSTLRRCCPCATCGVQRAEARADPLRVLNPDAPAPSDELVNLHPIGNYALQLEFADGHNSGFYTWEHLRRLPQEGHESA